MTASSSIQKTFNSIKEISTFCINQICIKWSENGVSITPQLLSLNLYVNENLG